MSHTVESCPLTKLNGGLSRLHSADEDAVSWLTNYGSWQAYEKKKKYRHAVPSCDYIWESGKRKKWCVYVWVSLVVIVLWANVFAHTN